ncbi:MAG: hypothetical protein AMXMBFR64_21450 [Myxococcales bacterium]
MKHLTLALLLGAAMVAPPIGAQPAGLWAVSAPPDVPPSLVLARSLLAAGDLDGAGRTLTSLLESYDDAVTAADKGLARYMLGTIFMEQHRWKEAAAELRRVGPLAIADHATVALAQALTHLGQQEEALEAWTRVARDGESTLRHEATIQRAHTLAALSRHAEALTALREVLALYPRAPAAREARLAIAESLLALGRAQAAADAFRDVEQDWPGSHAAVVASVRLAVLAQDGVTPTPWTLAERLAHGKHLRTDKRWAEAIAELDPLIVELERSGRAPLALEARREAARAAQGAEDWEDALRRWREVMGLRPSDWTRGQIAECLARSGRIAEAAAEHRKRGRGALPQLAEMYFLVGEYQKAWEIESTLRRGDAEGRWRLAWLDYQRGKPLEAVKRFEALSGAVGWERSTYWQARAFVKAGKPKQAIPLFTSIVERDPLTYYSLQANNRLYELGVVREEWKALPPEQLPDLEATGARIHWPAAPVELTARAGVPARRTPLDTAPDDLLDRLAADFGGTLPELRKAAELARVGQLEAARVELRYAMATLRDLKAGVPARSLAGAEPNLLHDNRRVGEKEGLWGMRLGHRQALSKGDEARIVARLEQARKLPGSLRADISLAASRLGDWYQLRAHASRSGPLGAWPTAERLERWRGVYPRAYPETMGFFTDLYGMRPELMWAVMRVESAFNPWAISIAGARGLLQVMPRTGRLIAARTGYGEFSQEMLLEPEMSIYFGTWYMGQLIEKFKGQEPLAITSYNTGPHRIASWLERKAHIAYDEFQEETPYREGREYTKKVLKYMLLYRWLYEGVQVLYVPNRLDGEFADNINF